MFQAALKKKLFYLSVTVIVPLIQMKVKERFTLFCVCPKLTTAQRNVTFCLNLNLDLLMTSMRRMSTISKNLDR